MRGYLVDGGAPPLSVQCDGKVGLTRDEMQRVDAWVAELDADRSDPPPAHRDGVRLGPAYGGEMQRVDDWLTALDDNRRKHGAGS